MFALHTGMSIEPKASHNRYLPRVGPFLGLLLLATLVAPLLAQSAPPMDEIRAAAASGDYRAALDKVNKALLPSSQEQAVRYELLMLKGECQLQLKDRIGASSAFKSAAKAAQNASELAAAKANALIVDRSTSGKFTPRFGTGAEPIDIMLIDSRKQAMLALQAELWSQNKSQVESALRADKLPPIEQIFPRVADMFFLELFAKGDAPETGKLMKDLGDHAFKLLQTEVSRCSRRVDYLTQLANSAVESRGWDSIKRGLHSPERDEVKAMLPLLNKIRERATEYRGIASRVGGNEGRWNALVADAVAALSDAESLYNDR